MKLRPKGPSVPSPAEPTCSPVLWPPARLSPSQSHLAPTFSSLNTRYCCPLIRVQLQGQNRRESEKKSSGRCHRPSVSAALAGRRRTGSGEPARPGLQGGPAAGAASKLFPSEFLTQSLGTTFGPNLWATPKRGSRPQPWGAGGGERRGKGCSGRRWRKEEVGGERRRGRRRAGEVGERR